MAGSSAKGNPAYKRMSNAKRKERMLRSFNNGVKRKAARQEEQKAAHKRNVENGITPWEEAKLARQMKRASLQK